ncbi:MAG: response regulator [Candidatus Margulisiibacteriota bacterium]|nr:response regulator [Candidatus Margulisiibacteriota bacterium]
MAKKILVVDDEPDLLELVTLRLKREGYDVLSASDGKKALELVKQQHPDLILLDLHLPMISGYEVCSNVKSDEECKKIPIIVFTVSQEEDFDKLRKAGMDDYIVKPFEPADLLEKVKKYLTSS